MFFQKLNDFCNLSVYDKNRVLTLKAFKKMQKYIHLFAIFFMGITPSLKAVEKTDTVTDTVTRLFDDIIADPDIKHKDIYGNIGVLLTYALRFSFSENGCLKEEKRAELMELIKKNREGNLDIKNRSLYEDFLNRLPNLDAKEIIDYKFKISDGGRLYCMIKSIIPLALSNKKKDEARYLYDTFNEYVSNEIIQKADGSREKKFGKKNVFKARLIQYATEYLNYNAIMQILFDEYFVKQEDMDCAFWMGFASIDNGYLFTSNNRFLFGFNEICRLFSNNKIQPSFEIVKEALEYRKKKYAPPRLDNEEKAKKEKANEELFRDFIRFFIMCRSTKEEQEQSNFDLNAELKKLRNNGEEYPELDKALEQIQINVGNIVMAKKEAEEKIKKQMDAETNDNTHQQIKTVAPNQSNVLEQIDTIQPGEKQINTMQPEDSVEDSNNNSGSDGTKVSKKDLLGFE